MPTRQGPSRSIKGTAPDDLLHVAPHNSVDDPTYVFITNPGGASGGLTDEQLRASPVPVQTELDSKTLATPLVDTDLAVIAHAVIQGRTTAGHGGFVDVKVTPSGALTVEASVTGIVSIAGEVTVAEPITVEGSVSVNNFPAQTGLTDAQLRASPVPVTGTFAIEPVALQQVADDYQTGEILPDQVGAGAVLTFTFSAPVQNLWVYAVNPLDLTDSGEVRVDPYGGTPSANLGIPVSFGGGFPISATTSSVKVFSPNGVRVTVYGNRRS